MNRMEFITRGDCEPLGQLAPGVSVQVFASGQLGAQGLTTCCATLQPLAALPYHSHPTGEAITALRGRAQVLVEGRRYVLQPFDAIHIPAGVAHSVRNASLDDVVQLHTSFPTEAPERTFVDDTFSVVDRSQTDASCPEQLRRYAEAEEYELGDNMHARDLFAARFGATGICGGFGFFPPGASLPCHTHHYDESITIIAGRAVCQVAGREYELSNNDTACIPTGRPHRFINRGDQPMAMIWVYAGDEPDREIVDQGYCDGLLKLT